MNKIIYVPLDERPCNLLFPVQTFSQNQIEVINPPLELLGYKKTPANISALNDWLLHATKEAYGLVVSLDMLIYGGIVPSRLHHHLFSDLEERLNILKKIKKNNPNINIYGFQLIMRCPQYNSADEEPDYFLEYGKNIHHYGYYHHLKELQIMKQEEQEKLDSLLIPEEVLSDFRNRRFVNVQMNIKALDLVEQNVISFFTFPQDDSSKFGWTAKDQIQIRQAIKDKKLMDKVYMYPGADEAGMVLMSRMACKIANITPKVLIKYPSVTCAKIIPSIEDRYLDTMVKYHVLACGGVVVDSLTQATAVVYINAPSDFMRSSFDQKKPEIGLEVLRNTVESIAFLKYAFTQQKAIIIGDITYGNGSDLEIYELLSASSMVFDVAGFGGWNTASNAIGSAIAMGFSYLINGKTKKHLDFLMSRYIEDIGYCGYVRQKIMYEILPKYPHLSYFSVGEKDGEIAKIAKQLLEEFIALKMPEVGKHATILKVEMPWKRMYEIHLEAIFKDK